MQDSKAERLEKWKSGLAKKPQPAEPLQAIPEQVKQQEKPSGYSPSGFAKNFINDGFDFLKGLYGIIPTIISSSAKVFGDPAGIKRLINDPEHLWKSLEETGIGLGKAVIQPYKEHGVAVVYHRPVTTLLDALTVISAGAASVGKAGRIAGGVSRYGLSAEAVGKLGPMSRADRLVTMADKIGAMPGKLVRDGIDKGMMKVTKGQWNLEKRREFLSMKGEELSQVPLKIKMDNPTVVNPIRSLSTEDAALWEQYRVLGGTRAGLANYPRVAEALKGWEGYAKEMYTTLEANGLMNKAIADGAIIKKYAAKKFKNLDADSLAKAKAEIDLLEVRPIYGPAIFERKAASIGEMIDDFIGMAKNSKGGRANFLEEYKGKAGAIEDPRKYIPIAVENFRHVEARLRFEARLLQTPSLSGAKSVEELVKGFVPPADVPGAVSRKHYMDNIRESAKQSISDPTIKYLLNLEYRKVGNPLRVILNVYDKILGAFRKSATVFNPKWYTGNIVGDAVLTIIEGGLFGMSGSLRLLQKGTMPPQVLALGGMGGQIRGVGGWVEKASEIGGMADQAARAGIITRSVANHLTRTGVSFEKSASVMENVLKSTQQFSDVQVQLQLLHENVARKSVVVQRLDRVIEATNAKRLALEKRSPDWHTPSPERVEIWRMIQRETNLSTMRDAVVRDLADDAVKGGAMDARIPGLREQNAIVRVGVDRANAFIGDYLGLDGFERGIMQRIIPFYPWMKAMTMLAFRLPFLAPGRAFLWNRYAQALTDLHGDPELPAWLEDYIPVGARANGETVWLRMSTFSPFSGLRQTSVAGIPIPNIAAIHEQNPFLSLGLRFAGARTIFQKTNIPYGESMVSIGNGDVYEFQENGTIKKTIPQTPFVSGLVHFFPTSQLIQDALTPYTVGKYNWVGIPQPALNPDGSYQHPRELWQRLASIAGVSLMSRNREEAIRMEKIQTRNVIKSLRKTWRTSGPEERKTIEETIRDYGNGKYRKIAR